jgi:hypothetical protein
VYAIIGVLIINMALHVISNYIVIRQQHFKMKLARMALRVGHRGHTVTRPGASAHKRARAHQCVATPCHLIKLAVPGVAIVLLGMLIGVKIEGWSPNEAWYQAVTTASTVGYGDFTPQTQLGRLLFVFFIPVGVAACVFCTGTIQEYIMRRRQGDHIKSVKQLLEMDIDGDGEVCLEEFQLFMLQQMGKVDEGTMAILSRQFDALDVSGDGVLSADDLVGVGAGWKTLSSTALVLAASNASREVRVTGDTGSPQNSRVMV